MQDKLVQFKQYLELTPVFERRNEIPELLYTLGPTLGNYPQMLKDLYVTYLKKQAKYEYKPRIGATLTASYDYQNQCVLLTRLTQTAQLTLEEFQAFLGLVDTLYSPVYPIGTVVELDTAFFSKKVQQRFRESPGFLVSIHGRRLEHAQENAFIDYMGSLWPFGLMKGVEPLYFNIIMIKRVIASGLTNELETDFVQQVYRNQFAEKGIRSYIYFEQITNLVKEESANEN